LVYRRSEDWEARRATPESRAADDDVADLRGWYRTACLVAFVECDHAETREWPARGCVLAPQFYPAGLHSVVARAREIAEADPVRFAEFLKKKGDGTNLASLGGVG